MCGIIYKFTIVAKYKFNGHKPFYVGQRWENKSIDKFLSRDCANYSGSGSIWTDFVNRLKQDYPHCWRKLIKREVLYASEMVNQKGLDILEEYYIKKYKSHYSYKQGGCNILWGGDNHKVDEQTRMKISVSKKKWFTENEAPWKGRKMSQEQKEFLRRINTGRFVSEETRIKISINHADFSGDKNPNFGNGKAIRGDKNPMKNPEVSKRNAELRKGKKRTLEQRAKMSLSKKGKYTGKNASNYGHKWTDEMKLKMSLKKKRGLL